MSPSRDEGMHIIRPLLTTCESNMSSVSRTKILRVCSLCIVRTEREPCKREAEIQHASILSILPGELDRAFDFTLSTD